VEVPRQQKGRRKRLDIRTAQGASPRSGQHPGAALAAGMPVRVAGPAGVHVREVDPPRGVEALEWILLTNGRCIASPTPASGSTGTRAPVVEELHKG